MGIDTVRIDDPNDPRLRDYVGLTDVSLRRRTEPAAGLFMAEGDKVIRRALAAGFTMRSLLLEDKWIPSMRDVIEVQEAPTYVGSRAVLEAVTGYVVHRGALAAMDRRPLPTVAAVMARADHVVVLEDVNDHTNIGAIFRSAAALGTDAVLLTPHCADPLYRRSVKVSMGAVFMLPWTRLDSWPGDTDVLRAAGFSVLALTPDLEATAIDALPESLRRRTALVLGAEGPGLRRRTVERADARVRIPMAAGVDSLNVAAAAAVACYALHR